jgi:hypothetical protein
VSAALTTLLAATLATATPPGATGLASATATTNATTPAAAPSPGAGPASPAAPPSPGAGPASSAAPPAAECPAAAQLAAALNALMPGLAPATPAAIPLLLASGSRLRVSTSTEGDVRVDLVDAQGEAVLHRVLPAPPRGRAPDCAAIAETIALIVERYLHDVGYEVPPLPPPAPKPPPPPAETPPTAVVAAPATPAPAPRTLWRLGLDGGGRLGDAGGLNGNADLVLGLEPAASGVHGGGRLSAGYGTPASARWADKTGTLRRIPLRLGLYLAIPAGPGQLEPGLGVGADVYLVSVSGPGATSGTHTSPSGDLSLGYALPLPGPLYLRLLSRIALAVPFSFTALEVAQVWETPRVYGEAGVELGFAFR